MNFLKRALIHLKRNKPNSIILFLLIYLLCTLSLGAISANRILQSTEESLWAGLPAVVMVEQNWDGIHDHYRKRGVRTPPPELSRVLFELFSRWPYIDTIHTSQRAYLNVLGMERFWNLEFLQDPISLGNSGTTDKERFNFVGTRTPNFAELDIGIIEIVAGTSFT